MSNENDGVTVAIRVRKLIDREIKAKENIKWKVHEQSIWETDRNESAYTFDKILEAHVTNEDAYEELAKDLVISAMEGINATIFAYGQTSSGKTYTMMGSKEDPGIIPRSINEIFEYCSVHDAARSFLLRVSYMEIYNENITDLLNPGKTEKLRVRENMRGEVYVKDLSEVLVTCEEDIYSYLDSGELQRHFAATKMNERSSRSHTIFRLVIESTEKGSEEEAGSEARARTVRVSQLNLVDLAGSERAKATGAEGVRLKEGGYINKSILVLSKVIAKLSENNSLIPFRESKLTRILQSSLGGNAKTCVICTATPVAVEETHSTLRFAKSAKLMKNKPIIYEIMNDKAIIVKYKKRIQTPEKKLERKNQLESSIKSRDDEIHALKGQLVGSSKTASNSRRRETFFHGPQGLIASPINMCVQERLNVRDSTEDLRRELFKLPAMVSDRSGSRSEGPLNVGNLESEIESLKSSLEHERMKNCKLKGDLQELEEGCMEMGDRLQEHIDEQQVKIDDQENQLDDQENHLSAQKTKFQALECILIAAGEEREDLLHQLHDKERKLMLAEERNVLILQEAEEQQAELERGLRGSEDRIIASPSKKRRSSESPVNFDPQVIDNLKSDLASRTSEVSRLEALLKQSAVEADERYEKLNSNLTLKVLEVTKLVERLDHAEHVQTELVRSVESDLVTKESELERLTSLVEQSAIESEDKQILFKRQEAEFNEKLAELEDMKLNHDELVQSLKSNLVTKESELERLTALAEQSAIESEDKRVLFKRQEAEFNEKLAELEDMKLNHDELVQSLKSDLVIKESEIERLMAFSEQSADEMFNEKLAELKVMELNHAELVQSLKFDSAIKESEIERLMAFSEQSGDEMFNEKLAELKDMELNHAELVQSLKSDLVTKESEIERLTSLAEQSAIESEDKRILFKKQEAEFNEKLAELKVMELNHVELVQSLKSDLVTKESEIERLTALSELGHDRLNSTNSDLEVIDNLRNELTIKTTEVTRLESLLAESEQRFLELNSAKSDNIYTELMENLGTDSNKSVEVSNLEAKLEQAVSESEEKLNSLTSQHIAVTDELRSELEAKTAEVARLEVKSEEKLNSLTSQHIAGTDELRSELEAKTAEVARLEVKLQQSEEDFEEKVAGLNSMKSEVNDVVTEVIDNLRADLASKTDEVARLKTLMKESEADFEAALTSHSEALSKAALTANQLIETLKSDLESQTSKVTNLEAMIDQSTTELEEKSSEIAALTSEYNKLTETLRSDLALRTKEVTGLETFLQELQTQNQLGVKEMAASVNEQQTALTSLSQERDSALKRLEELQTQLNEHQSSSQSSISELTASVTMQQSAITSITDERDSALRQVEELQTEMDNHQVSSQSEINQMRASLSELQSATSSLTAERDNALQQVQDTHDKLARVEGLLRSEIQQLSAHNHDLDDLRSALEFMAQERDSAQKYVQELQKQLDEGQTNLEHSEPIESLKAGLLTKTAGITRLEALLKKSTSELNNIRSEHAALKKEASGYKDTINSILHKEEDEFVILEEKALLEEEVTNLRSQLDTHVYSLKEIQLQLEEKSENATALKKQLSTKDADLLKLEYSYESKLTDLEKKCVELSSKLSEEIRAKNGLRADCDELMVSLQRKDRTSKNQAEEMQILDRLREELASKDDDNALKVTEIQECLRHIEGMEQNRLRLESELEELKVSLTEQQSANTIVTQERGGALVRVQELESLVDEGQTSSQSNMEHMTAALTEKQSTLLSLTEERDNALKQIQELQITLDASRTHVEQLTTTLTELQSALASLTEQGEQRDASLTDLQRQLSEGREGLQSTVVVLTEERDRAILQLNTLQGEAVTLKEERDTLQGESVKLKEELNTLEGEAVTLKEERDTLQSESVKLKEERDTLHCESVKFREELNNSVTVMEQEILTLISAVKSGEETCAGLTSEVKCLKVQLAELSSDKDEQVKIIEELNTQIVSLGTREEELASQAATSSAEQLEALQTNLSQLRQELSLKSGELARAQQKVSELQSSNTAMSKHGAVVEEEVGELRKSVLEYEMLKTSHFQLRAQYAALLKEKQLADSVKMEIEADYSKYQKYSVETINSEQEKLQTLLQKHENMEKDLSWEIVELKKDLTGKISTLTSEREHLSQQVSQYSAQLASARGQVSDFVKDQEELKALLQKEVQRYDALEKQRAEVNKNYLDMTNKYQAASSEADAIESKYSELDTNFTSLKESLEKEIIRRKYVETVARVTPRTYNPQSLEDFMKSCESDHTDYLNRIKKTYVDVGMVCQICDKKRRADPAFRAPKPESSKAKVSPNSEAENRDPVLSQKDPEKPEVDLKRPPSPSASQLQKRPPSPSASQLQKRPPSPSASQPPPQREKVTLKPQQKKNRTEDECPQQ